MWEWVVMAKMESEMLVQILTKCFIAIKKRHVKTRGENNKNEGVTKKNVYITIKW